MKNENTCLIRIDKDVRKIIKLMSIKKEISMKSFIRQIIFRCYKEEKSDFMKDFLTE